MRHLLRVSDLSAVELAVLLDLAAQARAAPHRWRHLLDGDAVLVHLTAAPVHERLVHEAAVARLGGTPVATGPGRIDAPRPDAVEDIALLVGGAARAAVVAVDDDLTLRRFASSAGVPVLNAGTPAHDPCGALTDLFTLRRHFGVLRGLKLAYIGEGDAMAHGLMEGCALTGIDLAVATPPGYESDPEVVEQATQLADEHGGAILETHDPLVAAAGADAVLTRAWTPARDEHDRAARLEAFGPYRVHAGVLDVAGPGAVLLHRLPAHRGEEVDPGLVDGPRSLAGDRAENGVHVVAATLAALVGSYEEGPAADLARLDQLVLGFVTVE